MSFKFHREPLKHQVDAFEQFKDRQYFGLFWEQRCRKTKPVLDISRYRYEQQQANALVVIAYPNGVHRVWLDEMIEDFPPDFMKKVKSHAWKTSKASKHEEELDALINHDGFSVLTLNCESLISDTTLKYLRRFFKRRKIVLAADEASWAARNSKRTRKLLQIGRSTSVVTKTILDGTPVAEGPVDLFYPTQFLRKDLLGFSTREAFKARYLSYEEEEDPDRPGSFRRKINFNRSTKTTYTIVTGTQNLEELNEKLSAFSTRIRRADISDAPPKTYQTRYFQLTPKQRSTYDKLRSEYIAELSTGSFPVANVLTRMTRLQMIARNYYPPETTGIICPRCDYGYLDTGDECRNCDGLGILVKKIDIVRIDEVNPATDALTAELIATRGPVVVWCRFRQDVLDGLEAVKAAGRRPLRFDGGISESDREIAYQDFKNGHDPRDTIVATLASGLTRGRDLTRAVLLLYFSNEFSLRTRLQSEDRAESLSRSFSTDIVDLVAEDTRDLDIIKAHREKKSISSIIMGDPTALL